MPLLERLLNVVVGAACLAGAAIGLILGARSLGVWALLAVGVYGTWRGMRRPPELTWRQRRLRARNRELIGRHNAAAQERELQEMISQEPRRTDR